MGLDDIPLFAMIRGKLDYINARQKLISQNVANADTPGYQPRDLKPFSFEAMVKGAGGAGALSRTDPAHMSASHAGPSGAREVGGPDSEVRVDGNQVVLEDQMMKLTQARIDYESAVDFYEQSLSLLTTAARAPGKAA